MKKWIYTLAATLLATTSALPLQAQEAPSSPPTMYILPERNIQGDLAEKIAHVRKNFLHLAEEDAQDAKNGQDNPPAQNDEKPRYWCGNDPHWKIPKILKKKKKDLPQTVSKDHRGQETARILLKKEKINVSKLQHHTGILR